MLKNPHPGKNLHWDWQTMKATIHNVRLPDASVAQFLAGLNG
jgi:hypothetical protein